MNNRSIHRLVYTALMAAVIFALCEFLTFPFLGSKLHPSNAADMLAGLILGPWLGGLAAGIGNCLFDLTHGYGIVEALVTFATKFLAAMLVGLIADACRQEGSVLGRKGHVRVVLGCVVGGLAYVAMYMVKTWLKQSFFVAADAEKTVAAVMLSKLPGSAINNGFAAVAAPILYTALRPALNAIGVLDRLRPEQ